MALGPIAANIETRRSAGEFVGIARALVASAKTGGVIHALRMAEDQRLGSRVVSILKAAADSGGITGSWGSEIAEYGEVVSAFLETLAHHGAFDRMLPDMRRVPLRTRVGLVTVGFTGSVIGEGQVIPITSLTLSGTTTEQQKATAIMALSDELARLASGSGALFARELRTAIAIVTDQSFIDTITTGVSPITSSGNTAVAIMDDLSAALDNIETSAQSRLYILVTSTIAKRWATMTTADGVQAFPQMTPQGGSVAGMPVVVSDGGSAGEIIVVDAHQIAAGAGSIELDTTTEASIEFQSAPTSPPTAATVMHSLWQHGEVALRALRYFTAERLSTSSVAVISGAVYSPQ